MSAEPRLFVDTNVLVYARDSSEPAKHRTARAWMDWLWQHENGRLSTQVLNEYYVTVTRKLDPGLSRDEAREDVGLFAAWRPLPIDTDLIQRAFAFESEASLSWWDAMIVAAASTQDCTHLLSEDLQTGRRFGQIEVISPFKTKPEQLRR